MRLLRECRRALRAGALAAAIAIGGAGASIAAELRILSGGAAKAVLSEAVEAFAAKTGARLDVDYTPAGPLLKRLAEGEQRDVVVLPAEGMAEAVARRWVPADSIAELGRVGVGVAVRADAPAPDITTPEAFRRTLLAAKSVAYIDPARGTSGRHFAEVLERLGIAAAVNAKAVLKSGGFVADAVAKGEAEIAVHQITEILPVQGVKLVGPLPDPLQKITIYQAALTAKARDAEIARAFLAFLQTPEVRAIAARKGYMAAP